MGRAVAWFDIAANDPARSRKFYADLFEWDIHVLEEMNYGMVDAGASEGIPGGIGQADDSNPAGIVIYAAVDDAKAALDKAESLGGKVVTTPYEIPGSGVMAVFQDPEGNRVGLWQR
ncbi:VOC family protein [Actinomadura alba]|uniref:VOC family protein n=1 Tax=Actinomadura alba TaxID=406431 RepID=A0ABR7LS91_9ACTN|nr:VOC family protein [Actinomadura alba]MBC6467397.1 VOC family protein [Actinomadura alba]